MKLIAAVLLALGLVACGPVRAPTPVVAPKPVDTPLPLTRIADKRTQIVVQWPDAAGTEALLAVEETIAAAESDLFEVDGNDIGSGTFNVFIYAEDRKLQAVIDKLIALRKAGKVPDGMRIAVAQYTDATRTDWIYKPVYPAGLKSFELM